MSPTLVGVRRGLLLAGGGPVTIVGVAAAAVLVGRPAAAALALAAATLLGWLFWLVGRACRSWGYAERADDLWVRHGIFIRRLSVVPYGRMQFIDVTAGPVDRRFGIATVHLHTAAAASDAVIPGLPVDEAARLRDRLAALGEARAARL